ncbi:ABC transporter ATP-binding protein [candidate division KSB1 bacterium]|nr:ABC transporter ATP-binding protein [candidate division KSB1 bacterium]
MRFRQLRKSYGETVAVDGLEFAVQPGEIFGLIGPDGAGKTTAMRIACALLLPDAGEVRVFGYDCVSEARKIKHHLGYMPQRFSLYADLTVAENLRFFADLYDVPARERIQREERLMQFSRLGPFRHRRAGKLSGGMKQKLALSCTLIHTPEVLILDEPTTGVDPVSRQEFWTILRDLATEGKALLVSTPYMDEAGLCDRVALMHRGRVLGLGAPADVPRLFRQRLIEVRGEDLDRARRKLTSLASAVSVNRFGDRLHVVHQSAEQEQIVRDLLADLDIELETVEPTIEDTFVSLMSGASDAA